MDLIDIISKRYDAFKPTEVEVPEWGLSLYFAPLTSEERSKIRLGADIDNDGEMMARMIIRKAMTADGTPAFKDDPATLVALKKKTEFSLLRRIVVAAEAASFSAPGEDLKND